MGEGIAVRRQFFRRGVNAQQAMATEVWVFHRNRRRRFIDHLLFDYLQGKDDP